MPQAEEKSPRLFPLVTRRRFCRLLGLCGALARAGHLPLLEAEGESKSGHALSGGASRSSLDARSGPPALKPVRPYLDRFQSLTGSVEGRRSWRLRFSVLHWGGAGWRIGKPRVAVVGEASVARRTNSEGILFEVAEARRTGGVVNVTEARFVCAPDKFRSLLRWRIRKYHKDAAGAVEPLSVLVEEGKREGRRVLVGERVYETDRPLVTQWTLLEALWEDSHLAGEVDFLHDGTTFRGPQRLFSVGRVPLDVPRRGRVALAATAQVGEGILPYHYVLEEGGLPQLVTAAMVSWALRGVD